MWLELFTFEHFVHKELRLFMSGIKSELANDIQSPFPLNSILFDEFISIKQYILGAKTKEREEDKSITDGQAIFLIVISKLQKSGVKFSSPGNSQKRNFICWFNSHFVINEPYSYPVEIKEKYFDLAYHMILNLIKEKLAIKSEINDFEKLDPNEIDNLSVKGKEFLTALLQ